MYFIPSIQSHGEDLVVGPQRSPPPPISCTKGRPNQRHPISNPSRTNTHSHSFLSSSFLLQLTHASNEGEGKGGGGGGGGGGQVKRSPPPPNGRRTTGPAYWHRTGGRGGGGAPPRGDEGFQEDKWWRIWEIGGGRAGREIFGRGGRRARRPRGEKSNFSA